MSRCFLPNDGPPTPPAPMKGSRSEPGGLKCDCTSGSIAGAVPLLIPLHTTNAIVAANVTNAIENGAVLKEYLHEDYQPHVANG
ncbi:hypothetical protein HaLaN_04671 [Haematococcus lacustris]|uniref:Uncharacterized protein n=1 Tax=Haematococcus lacustris TaxID=44745 RepID=A0A699Z274_HAELA|nr:hypothetical protein HaLaN_04671 [Haematococcus lacustris]